MFLTIKKWLDRSLEFITAFTMGFLVIDVTWQVITRFVLKHPSDWTEEVAIYTMIWVGLLGSAVALNRKAHLGIDYFVGRLPQKKRLYTEVFVYLAVAAFSISVLLWGGMEFVVETFERGQRAPATGIMLGYVYLSLPISGFFITLYSIESLVKTIQKLLRLRGKPDVGFVSVTGDKPV